MHRRMAMAAVLAVSAAVTPAAADGLHKSAYELYQQCDTVTSRFLQGVCLGFIGATIAIDRDAGDASRLCLPEDFRLETARRDVIAFVAANRGIGDMPAASAVLAALSTRYPCDGSAPAAEGPAQPEDYGLSVGDD